MSTKIGTSSARMIAHALLSAQHSDALAAAVVAGDIIIGNATPKWSRLAKGTLNQILKMGAALPAWGTVDYGELSGVPSTFAPTAHNVLSAIHTDTLAATVAKGDILVGNATPKWARLAGDVSDVTVVLTAVSSAGVAGVPNWVTFSLIGADDVAPSGDYNTTTTNASFADTISVSPNTPVGYRTYIFAKGTMWNSGTVGVNVRIYDSTNSASLDAVYIATADANERTAFSMFGISTVSGAKTIKLQFNRDSATGSTTAYVSQLKLNYFYLPV